MVDDGALFLNSSVDLINCGTLRRSRSDISYQELLREERRATRRGGRTFPPPLCSMTRTSYAQCPNQVPWVQLQTIRSNGRIVLQEVNKIADQTCMQPIRTNGRLVLVVRRGNENSRPDSSPRPRTIDSPPTEKQQQKAEEVVLEQQPEQQQQQPEQVKTDSPAHIKSSPTKSEPEDIVTMMAPKTHLVDTAPAPPAAAAAAAAGQVQAPLAEKEQEQQQEQECSFSSMAPPPAPLVPNSCAVHLERLQAFISSVAQPHWQCRCIGSSDEDEHHLHQHMQQQQHHHCEHHRWANVWEHHFRCVTT